MLRRLTCSFCGKNETEVRKLVAGPKVHICDECVALASRVMQGDGPDQPDTHVAPPGFLTGLRARVRRLLYGSQAARSAPRPVAP